ncbi:MAG: hypothetical protein MI924_04600, partial [Chloroflexales bacterium]|nr:hypothetical protein [Chloroflexales bacterium]
MHQPPPIPHEEGVGGGDRQIVQHLGAGFKRHAGHPAIGAINLAHRITGAQIRRGDPATQQHKEGMVGRGRQRGVVELQRDQGAFLRWGNAHLGSV